MENLPISSISAVETLSQKPTSPKVDVGYQASLTDIADFEQSLNSVEARNIHANRVTEPSNTERAVIKPLDYINTEAEDIVNYAKSAVASGNELTPSEIVTLTARSHMFMFHCQLTSNIANRTSDGLQQLFRQQS
jgi:hypothetical protein